MNKKILIVFLLSSLLANFAIAQSQSRDWEDSSGHYKFEGKIIARDDHRVVIEKDDKSLMSVELDQLSKADLEYLESNKDEHHEMGHEVQEWHLENGVTVKGSIVEYGSRTVELRKRRGKVYVNDKLFTNLPELYQQIIPQLVAKVEKIDIEKKNHADNWIKKLKVATKEYQAEGVKLEVENGDLFTIPLFMFTSQDREILEPGLDSWIEAHPEAHIERGVHSLNLRARVLTNKSKKSKKLRKRKNSDPSDSSHGRAEDGSSSKSTEQLEKEELRRVARLQLALTAYDAGAVDLWEVRLQAPNGEWRAVIIPARDNVHAQQAAQAEFPSVTTKILSTRKLSRR